MKLKDMFLDEWLMKINKFRDFPNEFDYPTYYKNTSNELNKWVHPFVNSGAMLNDNGFLTDHGPDHIKMLIKRVSQFIDDGKKKPNISNFECLILLLSIHIHDVGNILGRNKHEVNSEEIIKNLGEGVSRQHKVIWEYVYEIAKAHKGNVIQQMDMIDTYLGFDIRFQFLSAILKLADELSEDSTRADRYNTIIGNIAKNKPEAEIYHQYALSLHSLTPDLKARTIKYVFVLDEELAKKQFTKKNESDGTVSSVFLLDEIYHRTLKAHYERLYCMRFLRPYINFDLIKVTIRIKLKNNKNFDTSYELIETGMDNTDYKDIFRICPELENYTGEMVCSKINSETLC